MRGLLDTGAVLSVIPIEIWRSMGFDKYDLIDSRIRLSAENKGALRVIGRTPIIALNEVMLNIDGINIYTKTMITCDEDLVGADLRRQRRTKSEIGWTLCHAGRRCNAHRDGSERVSTCA